MYSAFYGDEGLRDFFHSRVRRFAIEGRLIASRQPRRSLDRRTISYAFLGSGGHEAFCRATGIPCSAIYIAEMAGISSAVDVDQLFTWLPPGRDLSGFATAIVAHILQDPTLLSAAIAPDRRVMDLRALWVGAYNDRHGSGDRWTDVRTMASSIVSDKRPSGIVPDHVAKLIAGLSPPPEANSAIWRDILCIYGTYVLSAAVLLKAGYTHADLSCERDLAAHVRMRAEAVGVETVTADQYRSFGEEWMAANADKDAARTRVLKAWGSTKPEVRKVLFDIIDGRGCQFAGVL